MKFLYDGKEIKFKPSRMTPNGMAYVQEDVTKEMNIISDIVMRNTPPNAKICFASTPFSMDSVEHRVIMSKEQLKNLYPQEGKMNEDQPTNEAPRCVPPMISTGNFRPVKIDKVANGFIIEIGCKRFVGVNWETVAKQLGEYWKDPIAAKKKYCK